MLPVSLADSCQLFYLVRATQLYPAPNYNSHDALRHHALASGGAWLPARIGTWSPDSIRVSTFQKQVMPSPRLDPRLSLTSRNCSLPRARDPVPVSPFPPVEFPRAARRGTFSARAAACSSLPSVPLSSSTPPVLCYRQQPPAAARTVKG